jgi:hypothetical protein
VLPEGRLGDHNKVDGTQLRRPVAELLELMGKGLSLDACKTFSMLDVGRLSYAPQTDVV